MASDERLSYRLRSRNRVARNYVDPSVVVFFSDLYAHPVCHRCQITASGKSPTIVSGAAVSTSGRTEWQVVAHEIGHNFGAIVSASLVLLIIFEQITNIDHTISARCELSL